MGYEFELIENMKTVQKKAEGEKKVYGQDLKFARIYEMIKMRAPISVADRDYYLLEKDNYDQT